MNRVCLSLCLGASLFWASAAEAEDSAESIASRALENNVFSTSNARAEVSLEVKKNGKVARQRRIVTKLKRSDAETRSFVEFSAPAEVAGTKFLSVQKKGQKADQFIYLPAFKKVKRVVGSQRSRSFMGTDFSFSDLEGREVDESNWKRLPNAEIAGQPCYVLEGVPKNVEDEDYGKTVMWVHEKHLIPMRIEFYDKNAKAVVKRFTVRKLEKKDGRWVASDSVMATLNKGTETRLELVTADFQTVIPDEDLTERALER